MDPISVVMVRAETSTPALREGGSNGNLDHMGARFFEEVQAGDRPCKHVGDGKSIQERETHDNFDNVIADKPGNQGLALSVAATFGRRAALR
jgi:hypothetical protein